MGFEGFAIGKESCISQKTELIYACSIAVDRKDVIERGIVEMDQSDA